MRIKRLQDSLEKNKLDLALIISLDEKPDPNLIYYSGYHGIGILAVTQRKHYLIVPEMEYLRAKASKLNVIKAEKKRRMLETLTLKLKNSMISRIGIDETTVPVYLYKAIRKKLKARVSDCSRILQMIRKIKDADEISCIRKACEITDKVYSNILKNFCFRTEKELKEFIVGEIKRLGGELAFPPIVSSGRSTCIVHYDGEKRLEKGYLMLDFGARYKGYCADMTRMIYLGEPSDEELKDYVLIRKTVESCEQVAMKKKKFSQIFANAIRVLGDKAQYFTHGLGHGLGLEIHESPSLYEKDKNMIEENIPFTIEPGIYLPNRYGIRIEDTVIIINERLEILTKSSKDLMILKKWK